MDWRLKSLAFHVLSRLPFGSSVHGALQRHVTRRYFHTVTPAALATPRFHVERFQALPSGSVALEFGAGRNLLTSLMLSHAGAARVYAIDLVRLATIEQVNGVIGQLKELVPGEWPAIASFDDLERLYRIHYQAPGDARATGLPDQSVDFICSTAVLEHIPEPDIRAILRECLRIASTQARFSFIIDYHDHYGTADSEITLWNFYRYSQKQWRKFNPPNHYQNRLRHSDHEHIFREFDLEIVEGERAIPSWAEPSLNRVSVCGEFARYSREDLLTAGGRFLLRPTGAVKPPEVQLQHHQHLSTGADRMKISCNGSARAGGR